MSTVIANIEFYTVKEVSELLNISTPTVRTYIKQGRLKGQRVGRPILISKENLKEFLQGSSPSSQEKT